MITVRIARQEIDGVMQPIFLAESLFINKEKRNLAVKIKHLYHEESF